MTTTIHDLEKQAAELKMQLSDNEALIRKAVERCAYLEGRLKRANETKTNEIGVTDYAGVNRAQTELSSAQSNERTLRHERRALQRQHDRIANPLTAGARMAQAQQAIDVTAGRLQAAQSTVNQCITTVDKLMAMDIEAREALAVAQDDAAKSLLASVKSGAGSPTVPTVDTTHMQAIETALQAAKAELQQAQHELSAIQSLAEAHHDELIQARADAAFLSVLLLEADFKAALTEYRAACEVARIDAEEVAL